MAKNNILLSLSIWLMYKYSGSIKIVFFGEDTLESQCKALTKNIGARSKT